MAATPIEGVDRPRLDVDNPRLDALNEIARNRTQQVKEQIVEGGGSDDLDESKIGDPGDPPEEQVEPGPEPAAEKIEPAPAKVKIKVDGEEIEVDQDAIIKAGIATLQKESAADKRLEEAARLKKQVESEAQRLAALSQTQQAAPSQDAQPVHVDQFAEVARRIQYGSEAEAAEALKSLYAQASSSGQPQTVTMQQVSDFIEFREATRWATEQFGDLLGDPIMRGAFAQREREIRATGDTRPYRDIYGQIGGELREWLKTKTPAEAAAQPTQTREERKARVVTIPTAASRQAVPTQPKEPTPSEIVEQIRRARQRSQ